MDAGGRDLARPGERDGQHRARHLQRDPTVALQSRGRTSASACRYDERLDHKYDEHDGHHQHYHDDDPDDDHDYELDHDHDDSASSGGGRVEGGSAEHDLEGHVDPHGEQGLLLDLQQRGGSLRDAD